MGAQRYGLRYNYSCNNGYWALGRCLTLRHQAGSVPGLLGLGVQSGFWSSFVGWGFECWALGPGIWGPEGVLLGA